VSPARRVAIGALVVAGALILLSGLSGRRGDLRELVSLLAVVTVAFFAVRMGWRWWKGQGPEIASVALLGALGMASAGWLLVALVHALSRVSSENFGMIIVWPIMFMLGIAVTCGGLTAAAVGIAAIITALTRSPARRGLIVAGGAVAVVLNLTHVWVLARALFIG
jgi:hypothetical protein